MKKNNYPLSWNQPFNWFFDTIYDFLRKVIPFSIYSKDSEKVRVFGWGIRILTVIISVVILIFTYLTWIKT